MNETVLLLGVLMQAVAGMACLWLAMERHHRRAFGRSPAVLAQAALRLAGSGLLVVAAAQCVAGLGWSVGLTAWFGLLTAAALFLVFLPLADR